MLYHLYSAERKRERERERLLLRSIHSGGELEHDYATLRYY